MTVMASRLSGTTLIKGIKYKGGNLMTEETLRSQINLVVEARRVASEANAERVASYNKWVEENQSVLDIESAAKTDCQEAEELLRHMTLTAYEATGEKAPEIGVGIRVKTCLSYDDKDALEWAMEHRLALKLDSPVFEKIAKTSNLPFVFTEEKAQATIATELNRIEEEK